MVLTKEQAKEEIARLIDKYQKVLDSHNEKSYNEARTKTEFIESLFECLNWDMRNRNIPDEVLPEDKVSRGRADYAFRINGVTRLFVEAKSLKAGIDDIDYAKQTIGYGWHKGVTFAVLTDFDSLKVFNCEWNEPNIMRNLVFEMKYTQYVSEFDRLWRLSKDGVLTDALGEYAKSIGKRAIRESIFDLLLDEFTEWRERLSKDIVRNHPAKYEEEVVDEIVQRILNRLIFIRMCEDKGIEEVKLWQALADYKERGKSLVNAIQKDVFPYYRRHYDSKLFGISDDDLHETDKVDLSNEALSHVIEGMYYTPDGNIRYDFSIIDADVLGSVYEQYLGHLLKKTPKRAKIEEKHNHRKEQGIYYTPAYIVDYIIRNTLGELIKDKRPSEVEKIKVLDPACGSGSFLIKAFDVLNEYYSKHDKHYNQSKLDPESEKAIMTRKTNILTSNLYGVDLDTKAVEIAQLNLLLKAAEQRHRLPTLQNNIKIGNSLIDDPAVAGDKAFKWEEQFKDIINAGGFDIVIGNPPYFNIKQNDILKHSKYFRPLSSGVVNSASLFLKRGLDLLRKGGYLGFIIPKSFLIVDSWEPIRKIILENSKIRVVYDVGKAFEEVGLEQVIIILQKSKPDGNAVKILKEGKEINTIPQKFFITKKVILTSLDRDRFGIVSTIEKGSEKLGDFAEMPRGVTVKTSEYKSEPSDSSVQVLGGTNLERYGITKGNKRKPNKYLDKNDKRILQKNAIFRNERIVYQNIASSVPKIIATTEQNNLPTDDTLNNIIISEPSLSKEYILSILNSSLMTFYLRYAIINCSLLTIHLDKPYLGKIPIKKIPQYQQQPFVVLTNRMLTLKKSLNEIGDTHTDKRKDIEEEIKKTDAEIDELVYKLYGITDEEKKIIKKAYAMNEPNEDI